MKTEISGFALSHLILKDHETCPTARGGSTAGFI
jgi:hypothetical protein